MAKPWARGVALVGLGVSCGGVEPPLPGAHPAAGGSTGVYLHGEAGSACGGGDMARPAPGGSAALPGEFDAGSGGPGGQGGGVSQPLPEPLGRAFIISEYVEGSATYKALEITALEDSSLDGCRIALYFNGGTTASGSDLE